ncbi:MAG: hypothetical protein GXO87_08460 [Chlorobi bacterium]|nr:hypothetical protein [Chlorobiota bacterium]
MSYDADGLTFKKIFYFWLPLAGTWLMMSVEGPFLAAVIARMAEPKINLAAYGVSFAFALVVESPIIMIMSAATALVKSRNSYLKLRNFTYALNFLITGLMLVFLIPHIFYFITEKLIELPHNLAHLTYVAVALLLPWPGAIGYRRFFHGVLIKNGLTKRVAYTTVIRIFSMSATALTLYHFSALHGVYVGAISLSTGVTAEAIAARLFAAKIVKKILSEQSETDDPEYFFIGKFYYPLALTAMLSLGVNPIVTFFMGQSRMPIESLAVLPVINSLVFIFRSFGLSFQEVAIALMGEKGENYLKLKNFALAVGSAVTAALLLIAFSPAAEFWFETVSGLSEELARFAETPLMIMSLMPAFTFLISFQRSILVAANNTSPITFATLIEVSLIVLTMFVGIKYLDAYGIIAAISAYMLGRLGANIYLFKPFFKSVNKLQE